MQEEVDRNGDLSTSISVSEEEEKLDFSREPVFRKASEAVHIPIPGLRDSFIRVKPSVKYEISAGRARFAIQNQDFVSDNKGRRKPSDSMRVSYDVYGLFLFKCRNCLTEIQLVDPQTEEKKYGGNPDKIEMVARSIESEKICEWIGQQIDRVLGWDEQSEKDADSFRGEAEGRSMGAVSRE